MTTFFVDPSSGNNSLDGLSYPNRKQTIASCAPTAGDTVRVIASPDPTSLGQTATWTNKSATVTLTNVVTQNVSRCESAWTASANVTSTQDTSSYREGSASVANAIASGFTTGIVAYSTIGILSIPSGYTQVSFWIKADSAVSSGVLRLDLCSDTVGAVPVASCPIPTLTNATAWRAVTYEFGALPTAIQSVALYAISDPGTVTINLDNILLCKTNTSNDSLNLSSLIGKNTGDEAWWAIRSINATTVILDNNPQMSAGGNNRGYSGVTESVTTWKRETLKTSITSNNFTDQDTISGAGTSGNPITVSGGWDQSSMSSQTGKTFIDGQTAGGNAYNISGTYVDISKIYGFRYYYVFTGAGNNSSLTSVGAANNNQRGFSLAGTNVTLGIDFANANGAYGVYLQSQKISTTYIKNAHSNLSYGVFYVPSAGGNTVVTDTIQANNNVTYGIECQGICGTFKNVITNDNGNTGLRFFGSMPTSFLTVGSSGNSFYGCVFGTNSIYAVNSGSLKVYNLTTTGNTSAAMQYGSSTWGVNYTLYNATMAESTKISTITDYSGTTIYSQNEGGTANNHVIRGDGFTIQTDSSITYGGSGYSWKISPTSTIRDSFYPVQLVVGEVALNANKLLTFTTRVKKNHATNISAKLIIPGGQIAGIPDDVEVTAANNTSWQDLTLTATPTEGGIAIQVLLYVWAGVSTTEFVNVDGPLSINQAT